jgi:hypothetical protein
VLDPREDELANQKAAVPFEVPRANAQRRPASRRALKQRIDACDLISRSGTRECRRRNSCVGKRPSCQRRPQLGERS